MSTIFFPPGVYFWVGSASKIEGVRPEKWFRYNGSIPFEERVDTLVKWMSEDDFDLGLIYFNEPDHTAHTNGPRGKKTLHEIERMDGILGRLLDKLTETNLLVGFTCVEYMDITDELKCVIILSDFLVLYPYR